MHPGPGGWQGSRASARCLCRDPPASVQVRSGRAVGTAARHCRKPPCPPLASPRLAAWRPAWIGASGSCTCAGTTKREGQRGRGVSRGQPERDRRALTCTDTAGAFIHWLETVSARRRRPRRRPLQTSHVRRRRCTQQAACCMHERPGKDGAWLQQPGPGSPADSQKRQPVPLQIERGHRRPEVSSMQQMHQLETSVMALVGRPVPCMQKQKRPQSLQVPGSLQACCQAAEASLLLLLHAAQGARCGTSDSAEQGSCRQCTAAGRFCTRERRTSMRAQVPCAPHTSKAVCTCRHKTSRVASSRCLPLPALPPHLYMR